jgi:hypothetical protein
MSSSSSFFNKFSKPKRKRGSPEPPSRPRSRNRSPTPPTQETPYQASSSSQLPSNHNSLLHPQSGSIAALNVAQTAPSGTAAALASSALNLAGATVHTPRPGSTATDRGIARSDVTKGIAIFRTLLNVAEKALDGLQIWGPKAGVATASEVLKNIQVRGGGPEPYYISSRLYRTRSRTMPRLTTYAETSRKCSRSSRTHPQVQARGSLRN